MMTYWEWAASKGISYRTTSTEKQYYDEVVAAEEAAPPYIPPPPTPPAVTVVNRSQKLRVAGLKPAPAYSRMVGLELHVPAGVGSEDYCYTQRLGDSLILYGIDLWMWCAVGGAHFGGFIHLMKGTGKPLSSAGMITGWTHIIPMSCGLKPGFRLIYCEHVELHFSMRKRYLTNAIRFGAVFENGFNQDWEGMVLFEISEG